MEIEKAKALGFCFGVKRTIDLLKKSAGQHGVVESLGAVVHNRQVVEDMSQLGVKVVDDLGQLQGRVVAITAHGVGPEVEKEIEARGLLKVDTTCPYVRQAQRAARDLSQAGYFVVVFGDAAHPEVRGVLGWAGGKGIAANLEEISTLLGKPPRCLGIVSQTTKSPARFAEFVNKFVDLYLSRIAELRVVNTICPATKQHQAAALELAGNVDLMVVVGDRSSANTRYLVESCSAAGVETHLVEAASELDPAWLKGRRRIGLTAGASTPDHTIDEVRLGLEKLASAVP